MSIFDNYKNIPEEYIPSNMECRRCHCNKEPILTIGGTSEFIFHTHLIPEEVKNVEWIFQQGIVLKMHKFLSEGEVIMTNSDDFEVFFHTELTPDETFLFTDNKDTHMQLKIIMMDDSVIFSDMITITVKKTLDEIEVL